MDTPPIPPIPLLKPGGGSGMEAAVNNNVILEYYSVCDKRHCLRTLRKYAGCIKIS